MLQNQMVVGATDWRPVGGHFFGKTRLMWSPYFIKVHGSKAATNTTETASKDFAGKGREKRNS